MEIFIIRHAHAVEGRDDAARALSKRGREQVRAMARSLRKSGVVAVREFWHSPRVRSRETAELLVKYLDAPATLRLVAGLDYSDDPAIMATRLRAVRHPVAVVGHEPHLSALASLLVAGVAKPPRFELKKCAVLALARSGSRWTVRWLLTPELR